MGSFDLCIRTENHKETIDIARRLGFSGVGLIVPYSTNYMREISDLKESIKKIKPVIDVAFGVEINPAGSGKMKDVRKIAKTVRKDIEIVMVRGGDANADRLALETPEVDIITHHKDMRINQVLAKLSAKNNVSVGFLFSDLLLSYKRTRISLFSDMIRDARVLKKYKAPFILSSGSLSEWDLRSPSDMLAFGRLLGYQDNMIKKSLSDGILKENRKRLGKKWVMPGVEIE
ncbi:RNase P subunit p30 family protein [Candidatus Aenigmatarchaeota archaeon]